MISCNLQGGLGNQLFEIAAAHSLALRNGDISGFDLDACHTPLQGFTSNKYKDSILSKVLNTPHNANEIYHEPDFNHIEIPYEENLKLIGGFQSEKYFEDYKEQIIDLFPINNENVKDFIGEIKKKELPITSLHVRRGDYLYLPNQFKPCTTEYYINAITFLIDIIGISNIIVISDDINWCKENIMGDNIIYSPFVDELDDLALMSECDNNIISNSSFAWWGAYLNKNPNKKVIAPKEWFGSDGPRNEQDLVPESWVKI